MLAASGVSHAADVVHVRDVTLSEVGGGGAEVLLATSGTPTFTAHIGDAGKRLVVDVQGADVEGAPSALTHGNRLVSGVMTQAFAAADQTTTRVIVTLAQTATYRVVPEANALRIVLAPSTSTEAAPLRSGDAGASDHAKGELVALENVRFEHRGAADQVRIDLAGNAAYAESISRTGRAQLELRGVRLPSSLERTLDVSAFGGPMRAVSTYRRTSDPTRVVVEFDAASGAKGFVAREGNSLVYTCSTEAVPSTVSGVSADGGAARRSRTVAREEPVQALKVEQTFGSAQENAVEPSRADAFLPSMAAQQEGAGARQSGNRRIDLDLKDADIHNVLRLLSDVGHVNIITSDAVTGSVTIRMRNVPWDQAMETVLQAKGLGMVRQGNMIRVAPLADLNKERELAIARRKAELQLAPIETRLIPVSYAGAADLQERAKDLLSPRGTLAVDGRTNVLIARDIAGNLNQVEELIRSLDTQTPQVLIEARIVEATSRYLRDAGIQWGGDASFSPATGNPTGLAFPSVLGVAGGASDGQTPTSGLSPFSNTVSTPNFAVNLPSAVGTGQGGAVGFTLGSINNALNLAVRLSAAEASGMLRIISSPRVLTLDNKEAKISQGTLIPFSQVSAQGVQTTFQEAKLQLLVKPHVTAEGSVSMHVKINRDEPDFNQTSARGDPTILKREAETELLILDGHTAVIGGIFTRNTGRNLDQVPLLGDIPILGVLFQRRRTSDTRGELVIFLTPRIVNRAEALGK
jgi:type IV pilus assembly protein PilQ